MVQGREILYCFNPALPDLHQRSASHRHSLSLDKVAIRGTGDGGGTDKHIIGAKQPHQCPAPHPMLGAPQHCSGFTVPLQSWSLQGLSMPLCSCWQLRQGHSRVPAQGGSWWPAACLGNACSQPHAQSSVLLASPTAVPLQESVLLILSFLPCAQQHSLLPALQGKALEAPGAPARSPSL